MEIEEITFSTVNDLKKNIISSPAYFQHSLLDNFTTGTSSTHIVVTDCSDLQNNNSFREESTSLNSQEKNDQNQSQNAKTLNSNGEYNQLVAIKIADISNVLHPKDEMRLFGDLSMTSEGSLRFNAVLRSVSIGYYPSACNQVQTTKNPCIVNLLLSHNPSNIRHPVREAIKYIQESPNYDRIAPLLEDFECHEQKLQKEIESLNVTEELLHQQDMQFQAFIEYCDDYLKHRETQECQQSVFGKACSSLYSYSIGRVGVKSKDLEVKKVGFSSSFLELLGIDEQSLVNIALRQKKIDFLQNKSDIFEQSVQGLERKKHNILSNEQVLDIVTFDGYPIRLYQTTIKQHAPKQFSSLLTLHYEFVFTITEIDVNLKQLEGLIYYRQQLQNIPQELPIDTFIQRELSYRFEDVEYSIHSEYFLEKFYEDNLKALKKIGKDLTCKYRLIK